MYGLIQHKIAIRSSYLAKILAENYGFWHGYADCNLLSLEKRRTLYGGMSFNKTHSSLPSFDESITMAI